MLYSYLVYAIEVWDFAREKLLEKLSILPKKAVRMMVWKDQFPQLPGPLNPTDPIFKELDLLKLNDIQKLKIVKFISKWLNHQTPPNFHDLFIRNDDVHSYSTTLIHILYIYCL